MFLCTNFRNLGNSNFICMSDILEKTEGFVVELLSNELNPNYLYHNLRHTQRVVKSTKELLNSCSLSDTEKEAIELAAWLHDTGYTKGSEKHEERSCKIAKEFLTKEDYDPKMIAKVGECIMATVRYSEPKTIHEEIIRDADASHFAQKSYLETSDLLREELRLSGIADYVGNKMNFMTFICQCHT